MLFCISAESAEIVNVEYIHKLIEQQHNISVPYNPELTDPTVVANMKYLLTTIDVANQILNGEQITDYSNSEYATNVATDTVATLEMVRDHIRNYKFFATTTPDTTSFSFIISASGVFHIDWGDGTRESWRKNNTYMTTYSHEYENAGEYVIKIGGYATGYVSTLVAISFNSNLNLAKIHGSLGAITPTIKQDDGTVNQPLYGGAFMGCRNLSGTIPTNLFKGIYGQPIVQMFRGTFSACSKLTGEIPADLFGNLYGAPESMMFDQTFRYCSGLSGSIPSGLFGGVYGKPAKGMFSFTFNDCPGLTGEIPVGLFGNLYGPPASNMFLSTFAYCSGLTGKIPEDLFGNISGEAQINMFNSTFRGCKNLTGSSPKINGQYLYDVWPDATVEQVNGMYNGVTKLSDYANIPNVWK